MDLVVLKINEEKNYAVVAARTEREDGIVIDTVALLRINPEKFKYKVQDTIKFPEEEVGFRESEMDDGTVIRWVELAA